MWHANKIGIIALLLGFVVLGVAYAMLRSQDELLAQQVVAVGFCVLLFSVALGTWLTVRRDLVRLRQHAARQEEDCFEETPQPRQEDEEQ